MKLLPLVLIVLILAACATTPQEEIASGYARLAATEQAQKQAEQAEREKSRQATEAAMMTAEAAQSEIDMMNAQAQATLTALESQEQAIAVAAAAYEQTQAVWAASVKITGTMADIQATQTAQSTMMAASLQAAQARADQMQVIANVLPFLAMVVLLALIALAGILVWWVGSRAGADVSARRLDIEVKDRANGQFVTSYGVVKYREDAELVDRAQVRYPNLGAVAANDAPGAHYAETIGEPAEIVAVDPLRVEAIKLVSDVMVGWGNNTIDLPGWRELEKKSFNWNSPRWQKARAYLQGLAMIKKNGEAWQFITQAGDVMFRLNAPPPPAEGVSAE